MTSKNCRIIFITGGVISSLGKGIATASLGSLLQGRGFKVKLRKLDPYLNVDPGTMNPLQHGEVFVTDDGGETDLDLGHYERFVGLRCSKNDNITTGKIYQDLIDKERKGGYLGKTVQVIPHVTDIIKDFILKDIDDTDFLLCEIGGTIGDIEGQPFIESIRQLMHSKQYKNHIALIHLTLVPVINKDCELKTKPTQHSVKILNSMGIQPDIILCRCKNSMDSNTINKISALCGIEKEYVICAPDVEYIYDIPSVYHEFGLEDQVLQYFDINVNKNDVNTIKLLEKWKEISKYMKTVYSKNINIAIVGKYVELSDAYKSLLEAITHAGIANRITVHTTMIDSSSIISLDTANAILQKFDAIIVPGGFGDRGIEGKILTIQYARENNIPFLGICLGFQLSIIEVCKNILFLEDVGSSEFGKYKHEVITHMDYWYSDSDNSIIDHQNKKYYKGGTLRIGSYTCKLLENSKVRDIYQAEFIEERHRHRFEFNKKYYKKLQEDTDIVFSGICKNNDNIYEIIEIPTHRWFVATQYHPEFKSSPFKAHPLFNSLVLEASKYK